jgi:hypothetical protein
MIRLVGALTFVFGSTTNAPYAADPDDGLQEYEKEGEDFSYESWLQGLFAQRCTETILCLSMQDTLHCSP